MKNWLVMTATDLGRAIGAGEIDPIALTEAYLAAIDAHPLAPRIYARTTPDRARAEAAAASIRAKSGQRRSALDGVPVSWKDLFDSAGVATEAGSALLEGRTPDGDAEVLSVATTLGLVCLGKTHMSELAFSGLGLNPITQTSPCINDPEAVSGGSSSGAAASVAFGLAAAAVGSDTGGSVRIPAAWNDLVGLKTTIGRVSVKGAVPLCERFDTVGPLCRNVEDAAAMLAALEGTAMIDLQGTSLKGVRFAICETVLMEDVREGPLAAFEAAVDRLRDAGAIIETVTLPFLPDAYTQAGQLFASEGYGIWRDVIEAAPHKMFAGILERFRGGQWVSAPDYIAAWRALEALRVQYYAATAGYDAVIAPASAILPPHAERLMTDDAYYASENLLALRNTRLSNLMGGVSLSVPTGVPSCGFMMTTPPNTEEKLLRMGSAVEAALA